MIASLNDEIERLREIVSIGSNWHKMIMIQSNWFGQAVRDGRLPGFGCALAFSGCCFPMPAALPRLPLPQRNVVSTVLSWPRQPE